MERKRHLSNRAKQSKSNAKKKIEGSADYGDNDGIDVAVDLEIEHNVRSRYC
jgi:hypothetical protein